MERVTLCDTRGMGIHVVEQREEETEDLLVYGVDVEVEGAEEEYGAFEVGEGGGSGAGRGQLALIYSLQLAEAYVIQTSRDKSEKRGTDGF